MDGKRVSHAIVSFMSPVCHLLQENSHLFSVSLQTLTGLLSPRVDVQMLQSNEFCVDLRGPVQKRGSTVSISIINWFVSPFRTAELSRSRLQLKERKKERKCLMKVDWLFIHHGNQPTVKNLCYFLPLKYCEIILSREKLNK